MSKLALLANKKELGDLTDLRKRVWRKSHSLKSVISFDYARKKFAKFLETNEEADPYRLLDNYVTWLGAQGYSPKYIVDYTNWAKKILRQTCEISNEAFREKVSLPTIQIPMDDKPSEEDIRRLLINGQGRLKPLIALLKDTASRPLELLGLQLMHFNLQYNPPYLVIPSYLAKNDIEREVFFTPESKTILESYLKNKGIKNPEQHVFLRREPPKDEEGFQRALLSAKKGIDSVWRKLLSKPSFEHLNMVIIGRRKAVRHKVHLYSLKKFAFTKVADTIGEIAAHAMAGHKAYMITYYKKTREERSRDYMRMIPKLSVLAPEDIEIRKKREEAEKTIQGLSSDQLDAILKLANELASGKRL